MKHILIAALLASATVLGNIQSASALKIVMSNDTNAVGVKGRTFDLLAEEIRNRLPESKVIVHHSGSLFDQKEQIRGLELGAVQIIAPTSGMYAPNAPGISALTLPFLLRTPEQVQSALKDEVIRRAFVPDLRLKNIEPVAVWVNGPRELYYRGSKPILTPADMKRVKVRVQNVPSDIAAMKAVGGTAVAMSWSDVPVALQRGIIDAVEPTPNALAGTGLIDSIDQMTKFEYQYSFYIVGANKQWWEGMTTKEREAVQEALDIATAWNLENTAKENKDGYAAVVAAGKLVNELTVEQRAAWVDAMKPVWMEFGDKIVGEDVMQRLKEIAAH